MFIRYVSALARASVCSADTAILVHDVLMSAMFKLLQLTLASSENVRQTEQVLRHVQ